MFASDQLSMSAECHFPVSWNHYIFHPFLQCLKCCYFWLLLTSHVQPSRGDERCISAGIAGLTSEEGVKIRPCQVGYCQAVSYFILPCQVRYCQAVSYFILCYFLCSIIHHLHISPPGDYWARLATHHLTQYCHCLTKSVGTQPCPHIFPITCV